MKIPMVRWRSGGCGLRLSRFVRRLPAHQLGCALLAVSLAGTAFAQGSPVLVERDGRVISLVPYAPNIVRVTISNGKAAATNDPGYGFVASRQRKDGHMSTTRKAMCSDRPGWRCVSPENPPGYVAEAHAARCSEQSITRNLLRRRRRSTPTTIRSW